LRHHIKGVCWNKASNKWNVRCKGKALGRYVSETDAARAYNVAAKRLGFTLNVIPPAGAAGAGPKHAAPKTAASRKNKKVKLTDTSSGAARAAGADGAAGAAVSAGAAGAAGVMRVTPAQ
jgi:hypothetical protein